MVLTREEARRKLRELLDRLEEAKVRDRREWARRELAKLLEKLGAQTGEKERRVVKAVIREVEKRLSLEPGSVETLGDILSAVSRAFDEIMLHHQLEAWRAWVNAGYRGMIVMPTGTGKTIVGLRAVVTHLLTPSPKRLVLILVPTRALAKKWKEELERVLGKAKKVVKARILGSSLTITEAADWLKSLGILPDTDIVIATYAALDWFRRNHPKEFQEFAKKVGLVIADEAHHLVENRAWNEAVKELIAVANPHYMLLTATPQEIPGFGYKGHAVYRMEMGRAMREGLLPIPNVKITETNDFLETTADVVASRAREGKRVVVMVRTVEFGKKLVEELRERGVNADLAYRGHLGPYKLFKEGRLQVLVATPVLGEGVDLPEADVLVVTEGLRAPRALRQRIGRALRLTSEKAPEVVLIVKEGAAEDALKAVEDIVNEVLAESAEKSLDELERRLPEILGRLAEERRTLIERVREAAKEISKIGEYLRDKAAVALRRIEAAIEEYVRPKLERGEKLGDREKMLLLVYRYLHALAHGKDPYKSLYMDLMYTARHLTTNLEEWMEEPDYYDIPYVDTAVPKDVRRKLVEEVRREVRERLGVAA